ncbi:hypothetical protein JZ751_010777 [Albula glossodonta]|uniref:Uncharacterized protein n=1 Tax=Albula glossodonta TaxID=121402 RepID=A0A8T2MKK4_9TELE|nr:hypothetical protein JZ751_010777 [Albula glossodonta]
MQQSSVSWYLHFDRPISPQANARRPPEMKERNPCICCDNMEDLSTTDGNAANEGVRKNGRNPQVPSFFNYVAFTAAEALIPLAERMQCSPARA